MGQRNMQTSTASAEQADNLFKSTERCKYAPFTHEHQNERFLPMGGARGEIHWEVQEERKREMEDKKRREREMECQMQLCFVATLSQRECVGASVTSAADTCALCRGEVYMHIPSAEPTSWFS